MKNRSYSQRLNDAIPGGAHTYSRGDDQFPSNAPELLLSGKGCRVIGSDNKQYIDFGMALRAVTIGYAQKEINAAALNAINSGNNLTRASLIELEAAEKIINIIDSVEMVKFTKNGSTATSAAIKLARAYTGRELVARCSQHPFFSYDDWFIGSTPITKGIPKSTIEQTLQFSYNDIASLNAVCKKNKNKIAAVILEPAAMHCPSINKNKECCGEFPCKYFPDARNRNFLQDVEVLCRNEGIVFILDETITGFRWHLKGAQYLYNVSPDITTFGKAMANGFSVAAIGGKKEIMNLGSILNEGQERVFLLSTTHGAEMSGLAAFMATIDFAEKYNLIEHLWRIGVKFKRLFNSLAEKNKVNRYITAEGPPPSPYYKVINNNGDPWWELKTLFNQELINKGVLMPWVALSYSHNDAVLSEIEDALDHSFGVCQMAINEGIDKYLIGRIIKPVFRKFN